MSNIYNSNFDKSVFEKENYREYNKTSDDPCAIRQKDKANQKRLKFVTTNHADLLEAKDKLNFFGMTIKDKLFVPSDKIDIYSDLKNGKNGEILSNCNVKYGIGQLPIPTLPSRYQLSHGDIVIEDSMRNFFDGLKKSCNPKDTEYHNRSFYIFNDQYGIEKPDASKSVETKEMDPRGGVSTRFMSKKK